MRPTARTRSVLAALALAVAVPGRAETLPAATETLTLDEAVQLSLRNNRRVVAAGLLGLPSADAAAVGSVWVVGGGGQEVRASASVPSTPT